MTVTMETTSETDIVVRSGNYNVHILNVEILSFPKMYNLPCSTSGRGHLKNRPIGHSTNIALWGWNVIRATFYVLGSAL